MKKTDIKIYGASLAIVMSFFISLKAEAVVFNNKPDDNLYGTNNQIRAIAKDSDGNTYIGGSFTEIVPPANNNGASVVVNKDSGSSLPNNLKVNGYITASIPDGNGGWYIGGIFTSVAGERRNRIAHIQTDGTLDPNFKPDVNGSEVKSFVLSGNDLYVGGNFTKVNGQVRNYLAKVNAINGTLDPSFAPSLDNGVYQLILSGSDLYAGGFFTTAASSTADTPVTRNRLAKLNKDTGAIDASFSPSFNNTVSGMIFSGSDLYAAGFFTTAASSTADTPVTRNRLAKLNKDTGAIDASFSPSFNNAVYILVLSGSDLYGVGNFTTAASSTASTPVTRNYVAKLNKDTGAIDPSFAPSFNSTISWLALSDSDLYVGGAFTTAASSTASTPVTRNRLAKLNKDTGAIDASFAPSFNNTVYTVALSGSDLYVGGAFNSYSSPQTKSYIAKFKPDGTMDTSFNPILNNSVLSLSVVGSDLYAGGYFTTAASSSADTPITRNYLAKLNKDTGAIDPSFAPSFNNYIYAMLISGSDIYAGGGFTTAASSTANTPVTHNRLVKLNKDTGAIDSSLSSSFNNPVYTLTLSSSDLYVGGQFTTAASTTASTPVTHNYLAKLNKDTGAIDPYFAPSFNGYIYGLALSGSDIYAGGQFTTAASSTASTPVTRNRLAKLNKDTGAIDPLFSPSFNNPVYALALSASDLYVGGFFYSVGDYSRNRLVKLDTSGNVDAYFDPMVGVTTVYSILFSDNILYAGGQYFNFLRFSPDTLAPVLTLNGASAVTIDGGQSYSDAGATALDANFGDLTSSIITDNPVNTSIPRTYTVSYTVSDVAGNSSAITRLVTVRITGNSLPEGALKSPEQLVTGTSGSATTTLRFSINDNIPFTTNNRLVSLRFDNFGNSLIDRIAISSSADFKDASLISYVPIHQYDLCSGAAICPDGVYAVYAKYFSSWGQPSETASLSISLERKKVDGQKVVAQSPAPSAVSASLSSRLSGRILLQVESHGEAWYVNPLNRLRYYLGRPADAYALMRDLGLGASNKDISSFLSSSAPGRLAGRILLQVQDKGQAYYVNPSDLKLYYLGRPADAYALMRAKGLGITDRDLMKIGEGR